MAIQSRLLACFASYLCLACTEVNAVITSPDLQSSLSIHSISLDSCPRLRTGSGVVLDTEADLPLIKKD